MTNKSQRTESIKIQNKLHLIKKEKKSTKQNERKPVNIKIKAISKYQLIF